MEMFHSSSSRQTTGILTLDPSPRLVSDGGDLPPHHSFGSLPTTPP